MNERKETNNSSDYLFGIMVNSLDKLTTSLDKLSNFTNKEITDLKLKVLDISKDIVALKGQTCPKNKEGLVELIRTERLIEKVGQPKRTREIILWVIAIGSGVLTIITNFTKIIDFFNKVV